MPILENDPQLWRSKLPVHDPQGHKYGRGVAVIFGATKMTGATRLAARACARIGAGLVKVVAPEGTGVVYRSTLHEEIIVEDMADFKGLEDARIKSALIGPGFTQEDVDSPPLLAALASPRLREERLPFVLDAGTIGQWKKGASVLTPHEGEFAQFFPELKGDKIERASAAAKASGAVIVLKGAQTVITDGEQTIVQDRAVPELATAGTGDVLAGMITGLIAQGMEPFWASAAVVWIHAEAGARFGKGLVASDLPEMIPDVLKAL